MPGKPKEPSAAVGGNIRALREKRQMSIRELAAAARVAPSLISRVEAGKTSPTVMSLQRMLNALDIGFHEFFAGPAAGDPSDRIVFPGAEMPVSKDAGHVWIHALPRHSQIAVSMTREEYLPNTRRTEPARHDTDIAGMVLSGVLTIEVAGRGVFRARAGDAFYIRAGTEHVSRNDTSRTVRLVCIMMKG